MKPTRASQPANALSPIDVTLFGIVTDVRPLQYAKARSPIEVTLLGIVTDVAGLLVILVTTIPQLRDLGIVGAFWVASIILTVEVLQ